MSYDLVTFFDPELSDLCDHIILGLLPLLILDLDLNDRAAISSNTISDSANIRLES